MHHLHCHSFVHFADLFRRHLCYSKTYRMLMIAYIYWHDCSCFHFLHFRMLVCQPRTHNVRSLQYESHGPFVGNELGVHFGIYVNSLQNREAYLLYEYEVMFFINNNMFSFFIFSGSNFIHKNFSFFGKNDLNLFLRELGMLDQRISHFLNTRFANCSLMCSPLNFLQHVWYRFNIKLNYKTMNE
jgi:hypothetical protein